MSHAPARREAVLLGVAVRHLLLATCLLLLGAPKPAIGWGYDLTYGVGCWAETPASAWTFACDTNTGSVPITISASVPVAIPDLVGFQFRIDGEALTSLPDWWQLAGATACRSGALQLSADFSVAPQTACADPYGGLAAAGVTHFWTALNNPVYRSQSRFELVASTSLPEPVAVEAGVEYYVSRLRVAYVKTVGPGACAGCGSRLTMAVMGVTALGATSGHYAVGRPNGNWCLTWQTGDVPCEAVPARNATWGQVKSLYR